MTGMKLISETIGTIRFVYIFFFKFIYRKQPIYKFHIYSLVPFKLAHNLNKIITWLYMMAWGGVMKTLHTNWILLYVEDYNEMTSDHISNH